jgi:hypothetical protein
MKALRILGMILSFGIAATGCLEYVLYNVNLWEINLSSFIDMYKTMRIITIVVSLATFVFLFLSLLLNNKVFMGITIIPVIANIAVGSVFANAYATPTLIPFYEWICVGLTLISFIFLVIVMAKTKKSDHAKIAKGSEKGNEVDSNEGVNNAQPSPMMMGIAQDASGNTISERERISRLRQELNGLDFSKIAELDDNGTLEQKEQENVDTFENTEDLRAAIAADEQELNNDMKQLQQAKDAIKNQQQAQSAPKKTIMPNKVVTSAASQSNGPADPYKQTILPRRRRDNMDSAKYTNPIGNTPEKIASNNVRRSSKPEVHTEDYKDKIFLGDSDRIWAAMKQQDRSVLEKIKREDALTNKPKAQTKSQKTVEINKKQSTVEIKTKTNKDTLPTIDWDD